MRIMLRQCPHKSSLSDLAACAAYGLLIQLQTEEALAIYPLENELNLKYISF